MPAIELERVEKFIQKKKKPANKLTGFDLVLRNDMTPVANRKTTGRKWSGR